MRNLCDTHVHTLFSSHAYSTVEEDVRAAAEADLELLGIADHYSTMVCPHLNPNIQSLQHFCNVACWPRTWHGVVLLRGCEADIVDKDGHLLGHDQVSSVSLVGDPMRRPKSLEDQIMAQMDYAIASVHGKRFCAGLSREELTGLYLGALEHPKVLMVGHIGRTGLDVDLGAIVRRARDLGKLIEVNEHSLQGTWGSTDRCREVVRLCRDEGCGVAVNTDAHISHAVGKVDAAMALLEEEGFPEELVATATAERFLSAVEKAVGSVKGL